MLEYSSTDGQPAHILLRAWHTDESSKARCVEAQLKHSNEKRVFTPFGSPHIFIAIPKRTFTGWHPSMPRFFRSGFDIGSLRSP